MSGVLRTADRGGAGPSTLRICIAFACVYVIWGSTYLAIRVAVQTLPPLLSAGVRFVVAGALMHAWLRWRGLPRPTPRHWRSAIIVGGLMLCGGNGAVVWAETMIHSSVAALLVATVPMWLVLLNAVGAAGTRPNIAEIAGLLLGFAGVFVLVQPGQGSDAAHVQPLGAGLMLFASCSWAIGSLYSRKADLPASPLLATGMEMLAGGAWLLLAGSIAGEWRGSQIDPAGWSLASLGAMVYLVLFGSLVAFTAYIWLLRVTTPAKVGTYAYVNPAVAVFLGWLVLGEPVGPNVLGAMALILISVVLISRFGRRARPVEPPPATPAAGEPASAADRVATSVGERTEGARSGGVDADRVVDEGRSAADADPPRPPEVASVSFPACPHEGESDERGSTQRC